MHAICERFLRFFLLLMSSDTSSLRYHWRVYGHDSILAALERHMRENNIAHSYLFSGPREVGKFTVAKTMAHILQCERDFCHTCLTCQHIEKGIHTETLEFRDNGESLTIDMIRDLLARLSLVPQGRYKIVLLERIERMTLDAANCLLKSLEEPTPRTIFFLTTDALREVPATVVSRCRVMHFASNTPEQLCDILAERYPDADDETRRLVSELSLGRFGAAFKIMDDPALKDFYISLYRDMYRFFEFRNLFERMTYVQQFLEDKDRLLIFLEVLTHVARKRLLEASGDPSSFLDILENIRRAQFALRHHVNPRLALENLMLCL